jgi:MFS family permease
MNRVVALLAISILINYMDRGSLAIAAPLLKDELGLSASQLGILLSSFFYTYSFFLPLAGWMVDRFDVKWVMAGGFFIWSAATALTGGLHSFATLLAARLLLGIGETVAYPSSSKTLAQYVPDRFGRRIGARPRDICGRNACGELRLASLVPCTRLPQHGLADSLDKVDAPKRRNRRHFPGW